MSIPGPFHATPSPDQVTGSPRGFQIRCAERWPEIHPDCRFAWIGCQWEAKVLSTGGAGERARRQGRARVLGAGAFETDDCRSTYEELNERGVNFLSEPTERFYGIEATLRDNSGNWFSMTQRS